LIQLFYPGSIIITDSPSLHSVVDLSL